MNFKDLKPNDKLLSMFFMGRIVPVHVHRITKKTVETKPNPSSKYTYRHGKYSGDALFVFDQVALNHIKKIDDKISTLKQQRRDLVSSLERIEFDENEEMKKSV